MDILLLVILGLLLGETLLHGWVDLINLRHVDPEIPDEFEGWYDAEKYSKSQRYLADSTRFGLLRSGITTAVIVVFILGGGFAWFDDLARGAGAGVVGTGLCFGALTWLFTQIVGLPFNIYDTFVLEEKYGFNKMTLRTFILDFLKELLLTALLGGLVFTLIILFFVYAGEVAWLIAWLALTAIQFAVIYIAPVLIMPLFNKFEPLSDGDLKHSIVMFAEAQGFLLKGIFTMDGSKRSTRSNAYFTGFGRWRRIVLYDTLVGNHTVGELVSVFAHEVGHYKLRHIPRMLVVNVLTVGLMLYVLSLFISPPMSGLYAAFGAETTPVQGHPPVYAGLIFFGFLFSPISLVISLFSNGLSRKHEFEADAFAVTHSGHPDDMVNALKKLSVDNLSDLTPHPIKVFLEYSHPPILERIKAIRSVNV